MVIGGRVSPKATCSGGWKRPASRRSKSTSSPAKNSPRTSKPYWQARRNSRRRPAHSKCPSERDELPPSRAVLLTEQFSLSNPMDSPLNPPMREQSLTFLKTLVNTPSPVGYEARGQRAWLDYAGPFADETFSDAYGNCVAVLNKGGSPRLMLAAHADEIAMAVNYINDEGFIYVRKMGAVDAAITKAQRVVIHTRNGPVKGVVGNVAPHLMKDEKEAKVPKIHDLFIDIGVSSRKEAETLVRTGDPITLTDEFDLCGHEWFRRKSRNWCGAVPDNSEGVQYGADHEPCRHWEHHYHPEIG